MEIEKGLKWKEEIVSDESMSAAYMGEGALDVFSTPSMIALMEKTAWAGVQPLLDEGYGTVGISLDVKHNAATPIGMKVTCESELIEVDGRKLTFRLKAYDEKEEIGECIHERFIVKNEKFLSRVNQK